jgi:hypothetical protein
VFVRHIEAFPAVGPVHPTLTLEYAGIDAVTATVAELLEP